MVVNIENGQGIIDFVSDGFVNCLKVRTLVFIECYDIDGTAGKYYAGTTDYERVVKHFNEVLINSGDQEVLNTVADFLNLFSSGTYTIEIHRNIDHHFYVHTDYKKTNNGFFQYGAYEDGYFKDLMFTQDHSTINKKRVEEYEHLITNGIRPKAVVFRATYKDSEVYEDRLRWSGPVETAKYILDGHHKLLAYQNLKIEPELVVITKEEVGNQQLFRNQETLFFDYEYFLPDNIKQEIIRCAPKMIVGHSDTATQYNQLLDIALSKTGRIGSEVWILFKEALNSGEKDKIDWAKSRLDNLGARNFEQAPLLVHGIKVLYPPDYHPHGLLESVTICSQADFENWLESWISTSQ